GERIEEFAQPRATMRTGRIVGRCVRTPRSAIAIHRQVQATDDRVIAREGGVIPRLGEPDLPVEARIAELAIEVGGNTLGVLTGVLYGPVQAVVGPRSQKAPLVEIAGDVGLP